MRFVTPLRVAALFGFLAVAIGAFGAHGLKPVLLQHGTLATFETGALYHLVHAVVLLVLAQRAPLPRVAFVLFAVGIAIFSGSLYVLAITGLKWLGAIAPIGGVSLLAGWLAVGLRRQGNAE